MTEGERNGFGQMRKMLLKLYFFNKLLKNSLKEL